MRKLRTEGAFTPGANEVLRANDLHVKSMQRRDRQSCGVIRVNEAARMTQFTRLGRLTCDLKNLNFGGYLCRVNQSGPCSSSDVFMNSHFATTLELPGGSPSHEANSRLLCSKFHARKKRISRANEANFTRE